MSRPQRTLADVYRDRPLTDAQCRRLVALLGLAQPQYRRSQDGATGATVTPSIETTHQQAS
ncbi:hypothetical protein RKD37_006032 [Streptomyces ambofaciens]|uniref:hypothetical protein n=1 Tax=Streptomyces sp. ME01-18h TaxID=462920 RepID=UPI0029A2E9CA|nr:hypothetical protein [Streptomyces sp. ME01-18h]MDX3400058.1 hypothetical protein [Streptomyces sp. ME01-18h]